MKAEKNLLHGVDKAAGRATVEERAEGQSFCNKRKRGPDPLALSLGMRRYATTLGTSAVTKRQGIMNLVEKWSLIFKPTTISPSYHLLRRTFTLGAILMMFREVNGRQADLEEVVKVKEHPSQRGESSRGNEALQRK
jgi:hypothetical protein